MIRVSLKQPTSLHLNEVRTATALLHHREARLSNMIEEASRGQIWIKKAQVDHRHTLANVKHTKRVRR